MRRDALPPEVSAASTTPGPALPALLDQAAAAILLVDVATTEVLYANDLAQAMAGRAALPLSVDRWGALAGLTDPAGGGLAGSGGPLSQVCRGLPVAGELIRREPRQACGGAGDEQARQTSDSGLHVDDVTGPLWVTGFPLEGDAELNGRTLIVFLRLRGGAGAAVEVGSAAASAAVRIRAVLAMDLAFTIADATSEGLPLVWVNPAFTQATGYAFDRAVGRSCSFLQGPDTDPAAVERLRVALRAGRPVVETLLNYRADGTPFWNEVAISPVLDSAGRLVNFVGIQADVTARVAVEAELAEAYRLERAARAIAESAMAQTSLLADVSHAVTRVDAREAMPQVTDLLAPAWCGWAAVYLSADAGLTCVAVSGPEPTTPRLLGHRLARGRAPQPLAGLLDTGAASLVVAEQLDPLWRLGCDAGMVVVPLRVREQLLGVLLLGSPRIEGRGTDPLREHLLLADAVATRVALALDISRLYEREHTLAQKLQLALLPDLPSVSGLDLVGHYLPSTDAASIGGDWYEVLPLPDGRVLVAIGDVEGHDIDAATTMGRLRSALQSYALEGHGPAALVGWLEQALTALALPRLASVCVGLLERPTTDAPGRLRWSAAGHPPSLLRRADGRVEVLDGAQSPMLGARTERHREHEAVFGVGDLLLMYTDGLIEDRRRSLGDGIALLAGQLAVADVDDLSTLSRTLVAAGPATVEDDAAFVAVRALAAIA
ncbi:MAG: SpoIIE family protein phosphatase [Rhodoferax sp.]|nr:SpoIIE family protein phosphatase [Actinomycetota bacterium]